ncbi:MAG: hypothetical protein JWO77_1488 [Ilumatobacteraceae bacterium]|nr:hypothetical protein [Ilumatobacteraceae bacterium]
MLAQRCDGWGRRTGRGGREARCAKLAPVPAAFGLAALADLGERRHGMATTMSSGLTISAPTIMCESPAAASGPPSERCRATFDWMALPLPPDPLPPAQFDGTVRTPSAWRTASSLLPGHLHFDETQLRIWNRTLEVAATKANTESIHVSRHLLSARVRVVYRSGFEPRTSFTATNPKAVIEQLRARGWPVVKGSRARPRPHATKSTP